MAVLGGSRGVAAADRVIHQALAKLPAQRYPSAAAMADDLRTVLAGEGSDDSRRARVVTRLMVLPFRLLRPDAEIDFLAFSLADAVTNSLSSLESLVVRSALAAARFAAEVPDLKAIASEANVDVVLSGTLLRGGDVLRVSAQLLEAPAGQSLVPHVAGVARGYFQIEVRSCDRSLHPWPSLSGRETGPGPDGRSSVKAYESIASEPLSHDPVMECSGPYLHCLQADPRYDLRGPAWGACLTYRKFVARDENFTSANRSEPGLELNPNCRLRSFLRAARDRGARPPRKRCAVIRGIVAGSSVRNVKRLVPPAVIAVCSPSLAASNGQGSIRTCGPACSTRSS